MADTRACSTRVQCKACPWKTSTVPERDIPGGYSEDRHRGLCRTIATPGDLRFGAPLRVMACHESMPDHEVECVGWVFHQLGPGNNLPLRLRAMDGRYEDWRTVGEQHERLENTFPKRRRKPPRRHGKVDR